MAFAGSPAKLSLAQAAEAELAKVEQDHAPEQPPADGKEETPLVAANSGAANHTRRSDDRCGKLHRRESNTTTSLMWKPRQRGNRSRHFSVASCSDILLKSSLKTNTTTV